MRALHYAAYFDVPQLIRVVLQASQPGGERIAVVRVERGGCWSAQGKHFYFHTQLQWGLMPQ